MGLFDPKVDANIAPTQQVSAGPSGLQVLGSVLGGAIDAYGAGMKIAGASAPSAAERRSEKEDAQLVGLSDSLLKVEALRRDGRTAEANRAEQVVLANAARDGVDLSSGQTKALFRATTGRDPAHMGMSQEEVMREQLIATPEFQSGYIASFASDKNMSEEERENFAMTQIARQESNKLMLANENLAWPERREAFNGIIGSFRSTNLGGLSLAAAEGKIIPLGAIDQMQAGWDAMKGNLVAQRPIGLEDKDWKSVKDQIDGVDATFTFLRSISSGEAIDGRVAQAVSAAIANMDISDVKKLTLAKVIKDPQALLQFGVANPSDMKDLLEALAVTPFDFGDFGNWSDPSFNTGVDPSGDPKLFPDSVMKDIEGKDPAELLKQAGNITKSINIGGTADIMNDADKRGGVISTLSKAFAAMTTISKDNKEFVSGGKVNEVFDGTVIAAIDEIAKVAPSQARTLLRQGEEALNQQDAVASAALQNLISQSAGFGYEDGKVVMNAEAMQNLGFDQGIQDGFVAAADKYYGGDLAALFSNQGRLIDPYDTELKQIRQLSRGGMVAGLLGGIKELNGMSNTVSTIRNKRNEFRTRADALTPQPEAVSEDTAAIIAAQALGTTEATSIRGFNRVADDTPFLNEVAAVGNRLNINPNDLLAVISFETVGTFNPSIKNPKGSATGLIQFLESTAKGLGTTTADLKQMSRVEQMAYVEKYLAPYKGRMKNIGDLYMAVHWPAGVGKDDSYVMYKEGSNEYRDNKNLDINGDGTVTRAETLTRLNSVFKGGDVITTTTLPPPSVGPDVMSTAPAAPQAGTGVDFKDAIQIAALGADGAQRTSLDKLAQFDDAKRERDPKQLKVSETVAAELDSKALRQLTRLGIDAKTVASYATVEEAQEAIKSGEVKEGDAVFVAGELIIVEDE